MVIKVRPESLDEYVRLHENVWPDILEMIEKCNIRNYSIYHRDGYLFSYFEYVGDDFCRVFAQYTGPEFPLSAEATCRTPSGNTACTKGKNVVAHTGRDKHRNYTTRRAGIG